MEEKSAPCFLQCAQQSISRTLASITSRSVTSALPANTILPATGSIFSYVPSITGCGTSNGDARPSVAATTSTEQPHQISSANISHHSVSISSNIHSLPSSSSYRHDTAMSSSSSTTVMDRFGPTGKPAPLSLERNSRRLLSRSSSLNDTMDLGTPLTSLFGKRDRRRPRTLTCSELSNSNSPFMARSLLAMPSTLSSRTSPTPSSSTTPSPSMLDSDEKGSRRLTRRRASSAPEIMMPDGLPPTSILRSIGSPRASLPSVLKDDSMKTGGDERGTDCLTGSSNGMVLPGEAYKYNPVFMAAKAAQQEAVSTSCSTTASPMSTGSGTMPMPKCAAHQHQQPSFVSDEFTSERRFSSASSSTSDVVLSTGSQPCSLKALCLLRALVTRLPANFAEAFLSDGRHVSVPGTSVCNVEPCGSKRKECDESKSWNCQEGPGKKRSCVESTDSESGKNIVHNIGECACCSPPSSPTSVGSSESSTATVSDSSSSSSTFAQPLSVATAEEIVLSMITELADRVLNCHQDPANSNINGGSPTGRQQDLGSDNAVSRVLASHEIVGGGSLEGAALVRKIEGLVDISKVPRSCVFAKQLAEVQADLTSDPQPFDDDSDDSDCEMPSIDRRGNATLGMPPMAPAMTAADRQTQEEMAQKAVEDCLTMQLMDELKYVVETLMEPSSVPSLGSCSAPTVRGARKEVAGLHRMIIMILYTIVCKRPRTVSLLDRSENRRHRNWAMSAFFRAVLLPPLGENNCNSNNAETVVLSKVGLARLDLKQKKIPRDVVESVLRPALMQFCCLKRLNLRLIVGLHSIVELFPTLFKEVFGKKILDTLDAFKQTEEIRSKFPDTSDEELKDMLVRMIDFFRLFASTQAFSCEQWLERLCELVADLELSWGVAPRGGGIVGEGSSVRGEGIGEYVSCQNFRAPLCRLLCQYPKMAIDVALKRSGDEKLSELFGSIMRCRHATALQVEYRRRTRSLLDSALHNARSFANDPSLADMTFLVGPEQRPFPAHQVVLASRSFYFEKLLTNGMSESGQQTIALEDVSPTSFEVILRHLYDGADAAKTDKGDLSSFDDEALCDVYGLAQRYCMEELASLCEHYLCARVNAKTLPRLMRVALDECGVPCWGEDEGVFDVKTCGLTSGVSLLRACRSFVLANLGAIDSLDEVAALICSPSS